MPESSLHTVLKDLYTQEDDHQEVLIDGYLVDVVSGEKIIEIQTRNFYAIKKKIAALIKQHDVCLVHTIPLEKWIAYLPKGEDFPIIRRRSPSHGRLENIFTELIRIPEFIAHPNFSLEVLLTREEEIRKDDNRGSWRRKGVSIIDHRLVEILDRRVFKSPDDFATLLPEGLSQPFTNLELAAHLRMSKSLAIKMTYCLYKMGVLSKHGKRGRYNLYIILPRSKTKG